MRVLNLLIIGLSLSLLVISTEASANLSCREFFTVSEVETVFQKQFKEQIDADKATLKRMSDDPVGLYFELRTKALGEMKQTGKNDFSFAPFRPILERITLDLTSRKSRKFGDKYSAEMDLVIKKANQLLKNGDPLYKESIRLIMLDYLPLLDKILSERHPELYKNEYHQSHSKVLLEKFLARSPDLLLHFSFEGTPNDFFLKTRAVPFQLIGINLKGLDDRTKTPFADNFAMKNSEFSWHDFGHVNFMSFRDLDYIAFSGKPIERIIAEWDVTRRRMEEVYVDANKHDKDLSDAMQMLLMELMHERGYQYSLTVLKTEFDTNKWVDVILRKRQFNFFSHFPHNEKLFDRLTEARVELLKAVEKFREEDQIQWYKVLRADQVPSLIIHTPSLRYASGKLEQIEIKSVSEIDVQGRSQDGKIHNTDILEVISAQVNPTKESPFNPQVISKIETLLWMKESQDTDISSIIVRSDKSIFVKYKNGSIKPLSEVRVQRILKKIPQLTVNTGIFPMEQVLGAFERGEGMSYTLRDPVRKYVGTVNLIKNKENYNVIIKTTDGNSIQLPLIEVRIDPLR